MEVSKLTADKLDTMSKVELIRIFIIRERIDEFLNKIAPR